VSGKDVVGVRFQRAGRVYYYDAAGVELEVHDDVVVEAMHGAAIGRVVIAPKQIIASELTHPVQSILRKAGPEDLDHWNEAKEKEEEALSKSRELVAKFDLPMKLLRAESNLEGRHFIIFFAAAEKIDFRQMARELAVALKARVELRQVGTRDASKCLGGIGKCGCPLCCTTFLTEFNPLSIKMAKEQNLSLDPVKISGLCGRLLCCLAYENELYHVMKQKLPRLGQHVITSSGEASVVAVNPLKETVTVRRESQATEEIPLVELTIIQNSQDKQDKKKKKR